MNGRLSSAEILNWIDEDAEADRTLRSQLVLEAVRQRVDELKRHNRAEATTLSEVKAHTQRMAKSFEDRVPLVPFSLLTNGAEYSNPAKSDYLAFRETLRDYAGSQHSPEALGKIARGLLGIKRWAETPLGAPLFRMELGSGVEFWGESVDDYRNTHNYEGMRIGDAGAAVLADIAVGALQAHEALIGQEVELTPQRPGLHR